MQKSILITVLCFVFLSNVDGQRGGIWWFDTGLKFQYGATSLYNKAIVDSPVYDYEINTGYSFGGKLGINHDANGLAIDVMYATAQQGIKVDGLESIPTIDWKALDLYLLYRNNANLGYFEIGPKISFIRKVEGNNAGADPTDFTDDYNSNAFSGVFGFGAYVMGTDGSFSGVLGLRFEYGFSDMISKSSKELGAPLYDTSIYDDGYQKTIPLFAGLVFELNWGIGYFGKATCGARSKFIMF